MVSAMTMMARHDAAVYVHGTNYIQLFYCCISDWFFEEYQLSQAKILARR